MVVRDGVWLAIILAIPTFILFWNISPIFLILGQSPAVVEFAQTYLHALAWGLLPDFFMMALLEFIMGIGHVRLLLVFSILSVALTIFCSFSLIFGKFGLPALGIAGAGWGTSISYWIAAFFLAVYVAINKRYRGYFNYLLTPTKQSYLLELLKIGAPMGIMYCIEVGFFFALTLIMGSLSSQLLAANQIALQYMGTLMAVVFSIAQAVTVRMGHLLGAGDVASAERTGYLGMCLSALLMLVVAIFYWSVPNTLISIDFNVIDLNNLELVQIATQLLAISAVFQFFESIRISLFGALRAVKAAWQFAPVLNYLNREH